MALQTQTAPSDPRTDQYRAAERTLWQHYGLDPTEHAVVLDDPHVTLRVTDVGTGAPVLFVGGTGGTGPYWAPLLAELSGIRALVLDRPGFGLSEPVDYARQPFGVLVAQMVSGVLDALGLAQVALVGASIGNAWALHAAAALPSRIEAIALLGGGPLTPEIQVPGFVRMLRTPLGALIVRVPEREKMLTGMLRGIGHGPSLAAGQIPDAYLQWHMSLSRNTRTMHHERDMVRAIVARTGFRPGLMLSPEELATIRQPALMVYGSADDVGSVEIWRRFAESLPDGRLHIVDNGGHIPWLDDAAGVATQIRRVLAG